jgi:NADH:ubiquinone oxidoreductase subunit 3 (subunit A)
MSTIILTITLLILTAVKTVHKKENTRKNKWRQFECGFNIISPPRIPFSFQFFLVALLFLIFDVEITLVLAFPIEPISKINASIIVAFLTFLTIGLLYEWKKGKIDWSKWMVIYSPLQGEEVSNTNHHCSKIIMQRT